ncbi:hypothetical protein PAQ31011_00760 [Pandoraea aquatica]|uniref:Uncharacterized protein n=1 Tax=Pandoraea aquatica TaxID=2508290 RepID=A0A5E4SE22_9BURK|nr:hypothetical protein [Pandoraea aquatica]VVD73907.1 hypothetical protein PAQ31011_00760 [Pandoraea aquatica]
MPRPVEYDNLIERRAFEAVTPTLGAVARYLSNAADYKITADELRGSRPMQLFTLAYEGYFRVVQAVLEFYRVRTKEAGRNLAIQRVSTSLGVTSQEFSFITKAHERRNGTSYESPFPPVSKNEAATMLAVLTKYLPVAHNLTGTP